MKQLINNSILAFCFLSIFTLTSGAQTDSVPKKVKPESISFTGSIDTYYHNAIGTVEKAPRTLFANLPGFALGMANLIIKYDSPKAGGVADLFWGPRSSDAVSNAPIHVNPQSGGSSHLINQMFVYYNITKNIRFSLGQFNSFIGYETVSPFANFHYSTSYLSSFGPSIHTGALADLNLGRGWIGKLAVINPTEFTEFNPTGTYSAGAQLGHSDHTSKIYLSALYGDQDGKLKDLDSAIKTSEGCVLHLDLTSGWNLTRDYYFGFNAAYHNTRSGETRNGPEIKRSLKNDKVYYGIAIYQQVTFKKSYAIGLRIEYFNELHEGVGAVGAYDKNGNGNIIEMTLSGNICAANFKLIPEIRTDMASEKIFREKATGKAISHMLSYNIAVIYNLPEIKKHLQESHK